MKYDPQRENVYRLEHDAHGSLENDISLARAMHIANHLCSSYSVPRVPVYFEWDTTDRYAYYEDEVKKHRRIALNVRRGGCNLPTLLHELAHHIIDCHYQRTTQDHGREFAELLRRLYSQYRLTRYERFDELAVKHKVKHGW